MKTKLIALLKTSFASKGFNAKELESLADLIISQQSLTDDSADEDLTTAVTNSKPVADFVQSVASRQVSDVKKPAKVDEPKDEAKKDEPNPNETATEKLLREILEGQKSQAAELAALKADKVGGTRREQFIKSMDGTSPEYQARELKRFDRITFKDDEDFTSFLEDTKEDHSAAIQEAADQGLGGDRPTGGVGGNNASTKKEATEAEVEAVFSNIRI